MSGGANYRLEIGSAIASGDGVANTSDLASQLALPRQAVNLELLMLERVGLLRREEQGSGRKVYFTRIPSDYWRWCKDGHTNAEEMLRRNPPF
jgi:predicted transcriptional regulator